MCNSRGASDSKTNYGHENRPLSPRELVLSGALRSWKVPVKTVLPQHLASRKYDL